MDTTKFVKNLRKLRGCQGLTGDELSRLADLRQVKRAIDIEQGTRLVTLEEVDSICRVLNVKIDDMLHKELIVTYTFE